MRFTLAPTLDEIMDELHRLGWTIGDSVHGDAWLVFGTNEADTVLASGTSRYEAWNKAMEQARLIRTVPMKRN